MTELIVQRDLTELSVVVPVYGCSEALPELHRRLTDVLSSLTDDYEIIFVDDRDPAGAWEILQTLAAKDRHVRAFRLSRNFGQAAAITAGLSKSRGVWTVVMDGDLEEPPEAIPVFYAKALEGYELVRGIRTGWQHGIARRLGSRLFRVMLLESGKSERYGTLSILSRKVVDAYLDLRDTAREYVLMLDWLGFEQATVEFEHAERPYGKSAFTMRKLLSTSFDGVAFRTTAVLRLVIGLGLVVVAAGAALAVYFIYEHFATTNPPGYTSLVVLLLLLSGFVIVSIGVVGVYVGMIFDQVRARPLFILSEETPSTELETVEAVRGADA
jgi:dolichol-phosphate mannosyltransferase